MSDPMRQIHLTESCLLLVALICCAMAGCYRQPSAPLVEYDVDQVELLRQEVKSIDWDE